ncbi:AAA family ATPase [Thalassomonas sp. M1454]|uniref:AAA family ATPase n=1 Tax=Thalassomonas sp. M1454 TaxID=2594477 RepID=UPI0011808395|nr:AAA family ATPase [Thalassomonas sp. M1454]TRX56687.1 AAA family ATPase [Thalassomonas sp. M1454]
MKLRSLSLSNFRQFHGSNVINFSLSESQKITVVHGENGSGKTTILNSFKWCFYGHVDFDTGAENLLNEEAISNAVEGEEIELMSNVKFVHEGLDYSIIRRKIFEKQKGNKVTPLGSELVELSWIEKETGVIKFSSNPNTHINQILPESLHSYFFFNGERIEKLANNTGSKDIRHAIKSIMGLEIIERASNHLNNYVCKDFKKKLKGTSGRALAKELEKENRLNLKIVELNEKREKLIKEREFYDSKIKQLEENLAEVKEAAQLQIKRNEITERLDKMVEEFDELNVRKSRLISGKGFFAFFKPSADKVSVILNEKREKGELPYKIKGQLIEDLLDTGRCICGNSVLPGTSGEMTLQQYKNKSTSKSLEDAFIKVSGALNFIDESASDLQAQLTDYIKREKYLKQTRKELLGELDAISKNVGNIETAKKLELERTKLLDQREETSENIGELKSKLKNYTSELKEVEKERKKLTEDEQKQSVQARRLKVAEECQRVFDKLLEVLSETIRNKLSTKIDETFRGIIRKPYWAEIDEDYALQIYKEIPKVGKQLVVEKSTGESQITSLSFIACIANLAKENLQNESDLVQGGIFPIVMDSPFGALDTEYRQLIAKNIPALAEQVVLFVSSSQWNGPVEKESKNIVGIHNYLKYSKPISENGKVKVFERTVIEEVSNDG